MWICSSLDFIIHRTIAVHHLHLQGIAARRKIGEGNLRTTHRSEEPLIAYSLHAVEEAAACRHRHLACSQLDGEGMILVVQVDFTAGIQRLLHHYPALVLLACRQGMIESTSPLKSARICVFRVCATRGLMIFTPSRPPMAISPLCSRQGRAIVELPLLQSVERIVIGHLQVPPSILALSTLTWVTPYSETSQMLCCLSSMTAPTHGPQRTIQFIDRLHLVGMGIIHGNAGRGGYPREVRDCRAWHS